MLTQEDYTRILNDSDPLELAVMRAQDKYNEILKSNGVSEIDDQALWNSGVIDDISVDGVCIKWEEHWRYGGYDDRYYSIPVEALIDDTWEDTVQSLADDFLKRKTLSKEKERLAREIQELTTYKKLHDKYGDTNE